MNTFFNLDALRLTRSDVVKLLVGVPVATVVTYYSLKWMKERFDLDPTRKLKRQARLQAQELFKRLGDESDFKVSPDQLNDYELVVATNLVVPSDILVGWNNIAGLDSLIQELRECVIFPVRHKDCFNQSELCQPPKGVLLHGPPGCGKTLVAKATAKEAGMRFINIDISNLTGMWYGESEKLATAVFSLALKIQPCIIFIDEIDSFLRSRNQRDHEVTAKMKTLFMMHWDGLSTKSNAVIVMGATNRPKDLDKAILRRMTAQFHIGMPTETQRFQILQLILANERTDDSVEIDRLAKMTNGFSGSDLYEICRAAAVHRMRQVIHSNETESNVSTNTPANPSFAISMDDLLGSYNKMVESE